MQIREVCRVRPVSIVDDHVLQVLGRKGGLLRGRLHEPGLFGGRARLPLIRARHHDGLVRGHVLVHLHVIKVLRTME